MSPLVSRAPALAAMAAIALLARWAGGQEQAPGAAPADPLADLPSFGESFLRMLLWLGVVLALLLVAAKLLPRWLRRSPPATQAPGRIEVLAAATLEPRRRLYLVRVAGRRVLIGSSESGLCRLAGEDLGEAGLCTAPPAAAAPADAPPPTPIPPGSPTPGESPRALRTPAGAGP